MVIIMPAGYGGKWWPRGTGSETIVRDTVAKWRKGWNPPVTTAARLPSVSGKPLVDALENNQGRRKLCIPIY